MVIKVLKLQILFSWCSIHRTRWYFTNLEGKIQKAYKASYPPGEAKEDWQIINELAEFMNNRKLFNDKDELRKQYV